MKSKYFGYLIAFALGIIFCLILVHHDRAWGPTELKVKQDLVFDNNMIIPKGAYIRFIKGYPQGYFIYATYFRARGGFEKYFAENDPSKKDIRVTTRLVDSLLVTD